MDIPSSTTSGRRRLPTTHYAEDQAFDQIAKEVSKIITHFVFNIYPYSISFGRGDLGQK